MRSAGSEEPDGTPSRPQVPRRISLCQWSLGAEAVAKPRGGVIAACCLSAKSTVQELERKIFRIVARNVRVRGYCDVDPGTLRFTSPLGTL